MVKIDFDMPENCEVCPLSYVDCDYYDNLWCNLIKSGDVHQMTTERHPDCPLIDCDDGIKRKKV